jgi:hypothetical protein
MMGRRYKITMRTKLEFVPGSDGILLRPAKEEGSFKELASSASKKWAVGEMLKRLDELRRERSSRHDSSSTCLLHASGNTSEIAGISCLDAQHKGVYADNN